MQRAYFSKYASLNIRYKGISFLADLKDLLKDDFKLPWVQSLLSRLTKMYYWHSALNCPSTTSWPTILKLNIPIKTKIHFKNPYFVYSFIYKLKFKASEKVRPAAEETEIVQNLLSPKISLGFMNLNVKNKNPQTKTE